MVKFNNKIKRLFIYTYFVTTISLVKWMDDVFTDRLNSVISVVVNVSVVSSLTCYDCERSNYVDQNTGYYHTGQHGCGEWMEGGNYTKTCPTHVKYCLVSTI